VLEDASHGEIAEALSLPLGTVKSYIRRGLDLVRASLSSDSKGNK
jgi:RNA polymerase sigma-70 factor, ECF subfamily